MDRRNWVKEQLDKLSDAQYVEVWNEYCNENGYTDGIINPMEQFNDMFRDDYEPLEIADAVRGGNFNANDDWFVFKEMYGLELTSDCDARYLSEEDELIDYIVDNICDAEYVRMFDDAEYREEFKSDEKFDEKTWERFENWFDETYTCYMFELDPETIIEEWLNEEMDRK